MKTRVAYWIIVYHTDGSKPHTQYLLPNELYLVATWLKDEAKYSHCEIYRENLSINHWLFT